jgi:DNA gyrase subunit B
MSALLDTAPVRADHLLDPAVTGPWLAELESKVNADGLGRPRYRLEIIDSETGPSLRITREHHGLSVLQHWPQTFFGSGDYQAISTLASQLAGLVQSGAEVRRGGRGTAVRNFAEASAWLLEEAKRGRTIQRFKGLGEMNPEQLWETTVNPDTRRLLQVTIEDAVAADQMFAMLMGEAVEPRRNFIEDNALKVGNLDI